MHSQHDHPRFEPMSVGALADTEYLRESFRDSEMKHQAAEDDAAEPRQGPWWSVVNTIASIFRRH